MLELDYPIKDLVGADYNPRQIDEESLKTLRASIKTLGIVKPIIVSGNLIVAGHQRTKALLAAGIDKAPVYLLPKNINQTDEIRFNQLHNGTDFDSGDERAWVGRSENLGFEMVPPIKLRGNMRAKMANVRNEICKLIIKYGNWGACVATQAGKVIHAGQYVLACRAMGIPARVYRIPNDKAKIAAEFLNKKYGKFSYEHLEKTTFIQTFAQKFRLRNDEEVEKPFNASPTYEKSLIPNYKKGERILDFGCGQADYVKKLRKIGYDIHGVELFYRKGNFIDSTMVHKMIDSGGVVGADNLASKSVNPAVFIGAPKFHSGGLVGYEVPIIAKRGETIFTKGQMQALGGELNRKTPVNVNVNVHNNASGTKAYATSSQDNDGNVSIDVIIEQIESTIGKNISKGEGLSPILEQRYALNPAYGSYR